MAVYYLAAYVGSGSAEDPHRPSGADETDEWHSIDLRPPGQAEGRAILRVDKALPPSPQRLRLGGHLDASIGPVRKAVASHLGVDLTATTVREMIADLLIRHGNDVRKDRWNQLKPERDGWHRIYLGELVHESPGLAALSLSDSFTRSDSTNINTGAPFTWGGVEVASSQIVSNALRNQTTNANVKLLRAESDLASSNQFSQFTLFLVTTTSLKAGPRARCNVSDNAGYHASVQTNSQSYRIGKTDGSGAETVLVTKTSSVTPTSGKVLRLEVTGSSLSSFLDPSGSNDTQTVTDTSITVGVRAGIILSGSTSGVRVGGDDWSAGDLGPTPVTAVLSAPLGAIAATATAVPKVIAVLAAPLGTLAAAATAKATEPATLAAPLGRLTASVTASLSHPATLAAVLGGLTAAATATPSHPATLTAPLGSLAAALAATVTPAGGGPVLAAPLGALSAGATAAIQHAAALSSPLGRLTATASATPTEPVTLTAPLGALTAHATAGVNIPAVLHAALGPLVATAQATLTHAATLNAPLGGLHAAASATIIRAAVLTAVLGALEAHATATSGPPSPAGPGYSYERTYALTAAGTYRTDNSATYRPDNRRRYP